jgi:hypothetical protein
MTLAVKLAGMGIPAEAARELASALAADAGTVDASTFEIDNVEVTASAAELNIMDGCTATAAELNNVADISARAVAAGSTLALVEATHAERLIKLDTATGSVVTLPAATGSGARYYFAVTVLATSNSHIIKVNATPGTDVMRGFMLNTDSDTSDAFTGFNTTNTSDTITLNRSTTGSVYIGEFIEIWDIKAGFFSVRGWYASTGSPGTPFSAAVP